MLLYVFRIYGILNNRQPWPRVMFNEDSLSSPMERSPCKVGAGTWANKRSHCVIGTQRLFNAAEIKSNVCRALNWIFLLLRQRYVLQIIIERCSVIRKKLSLIRIADVVMYETIISCRTTISTQNRKFIIPQHLINSLIYYLTHPLKKENHKPSKKTEYHHLKKISRYIN